jgi:predicted lipid-binding transport protein (Tim44 family)
MQRTHRALAMLALGLALVSTTTLAAGAAPPRAGTQDRHDQLAQREALYQSELEHNLRQRNQPGQEIVAEHGLLAQRKALYQSELERTLARHRALGLSAAQPAARTDQAAPSPGVDVLATLMVGLVGGLLGGAVAMVGWTTTTRRRLHRAAAGT